MSLVHPMEVPELRTEKSFTISDPVGYVTQVHSKPLFYRPTPGSDFALINNSLKSATGDPNWDMQMGGGLYDMNLNLAFDSVDGIGLMKENMSCFFKPVGIYVYSSDLKTQKLFCELQKVEFSIHDDNSGICPRSWAEAKGAFGKGIDVSYIPDTHAFKIFITVNSIDAFGFLATCKDDDLVGVVYQMDLSGDVKMLFGDSVVPWDKKGSKDFSDKIYFRSASDDLLWFVPPPVVRDAVEKHICVGKHFFEVEDTLIYSVSLFPVSYFKTAIYPIVIDPDTYYSDTADGHIRGFSSSTYATALVTSTDYDTTSSYMNVGQSYQEPNGAGGYQVWRGYVSFDTSGLPDTDVIDSVYLWMKVYLMYNNTDFGIYARKHNWSSPIDASNRETNYDGCRTATTDALWQGTIIITEGIYFSSGALDTSRVSKTGTTYYSLISDSDYGSDTPTGNEYISIHSANALGTTSDPYLVVTHHSGC